MLNWIKALRLKHEIVEKLELFEESIGLIDERVEKLDSKLMKDRYQKGGHITQIKKDIEALNLAVNSIIEALEEPSEAQGSTFGKEKDLSEEDKKSLRIQASREDSLHTEEI